MFELEKPKLSSGARLHQTLNSGPMSSEVEPREAYQKIRERMLELEIERDEQ
jgi:hypothetical protein